MGTTIDHSVLNFAMSESSTSNNREMKEFKDYGLSGKSVICFAGEDWWIHHPHSKNHILRRLAGQNKVLFVNSITMGLPSMSNADFFFKIRNKLRSYARWLKRIPDGLYVMTPVSFPVYGNAVGRFINRWLVALQLRLVMSILGMHKPIVWVAIPSAADVVELLGRGLLLYQISDKYDANEDSALSRDIIRGWDQNLKERASLVIYSGRKLFEESTVPNRYFLEQAVDFNHFAETATEVAEEVRNIPKPILGYFGSMDYVMDVELMEEVARLRPDWDWLLIGRKSNLVKLASPNFHYLGSKPYADLPKYLRQIDVYVLPWQQKNVFTSYGSAIKVREYLATGKPVVISPLYEYLKTPGVRIYRTVQEFIAAVEDALANDTERDRLARQAVVRDCTWDVRTKQVAALITKLLTNQTSFDVRAYDVRFKASETFDEGGV